MTRIRRNCSRFRVDGRPRTLGLERYIAPSRRVRYLMRNFIQRLCVRMIRALREVFV
jgi:hypothetical protein